MNEDPIAACIKSFRAHQDMWQDYALGSVDRATKLFDDETASSLLWLELSVLNKGQLTSPPEQTDWALIDQQCALWDRLKMLADIIEEDGIWGHLGTTKSKLWAQRPNWTLDD